MSATTQRHTATFPKARSRSSRRQATEIRPSQVPELRSAGDGRAFSVVDQIKQFRKPMAVHELAPILGVSDAVLYRMVRDGKIPQLIVPGRRVTRFDPASIVFWLCKNNPLLNQVQKAS